LWIHENRAWGERMRKKIQGCRLKASVVVKDSGPKVSKVIRVIVQSEINPEDNPAYICHALLGPGTHGRRNSCH
jgi:hypothetical protein